MVVNGVDTQATAEAWLKARSLLDSRRSLSIRYKIGDAESVPWGCIYLFPMIEIV